MQENLIYLSHRPQINISCPSRTRMWLVFTCAFLCVLQSAISDDGRSLLVAISAFTAAILLELLLTWHKHGAKMILDGSAAATAMILTILLPNLIHPVYAALGTAFAIVVVKYSFGGLGSNWLNPALGGWLFIRFSWPHSFTKVLQESYNSITELAINVKPSLLDDSVTSFLNKTIFTISAAKMPSGYIDLLFNDAPAIIADRGLFALLAGTVIITAFGINRGWAPLVFLAVYGFLIRAAGGLSGDVWNGDVLYGVLSGGTIAAAFILAVEPASSAKLKYGIILTVILSAVFSWIFRYRCMELSGCIIAVALINCFIPLIRFFENKFYHFQCKKIENQENLK